MPQTNVGGIRGRRAVGPLTPLRGTNPFIDQMGEESRKKRQAKERQEQLYLADTENIITRGRDTYAREQAAANRPLSQPQPQSVGSSFTPSGTNSIYDDARERADDQRERERLEFASRIQEQNEARRMSAIKGLLKSFGGGLTPDGPDTGGIDPDVLRQEQAAQNAAFNRAKDLTGQTGRASIRSLGEIGAARGLNTSALGLQDAGGVISAGQAQLADTAREQAIQGAQLARQRASEAMQNRLTRRGQNLNFMGGALSGLYNTLRY